MTKVKYVGDDQGHGPAVMEAHGYRFEKGKAVEVDEKTEEGKKALRRFSGNSHFEVEGEKKDDPNRARGPVRPPEATSPRMAPGRPHTMSPDGETGEAEKQRAAVRAEEDRQRMEAEEQERYGGPRAAKADDDDDKAGNVRKTGKRG